jgi:hypothetical protein
MLAVLTFIGLPFASENHKYDSKEGKKLKIQPASDMMIFYKEIIEKGTHNFTTKIIDDMITTC